MDMISVENLVLGARVGVSEQERSTTQRLCLNVVVGADLSEAVKSDKICASVNYAEIKKLVKRIVNVSAFCLIETLGHKVASEILEEFPVFEARVSIHKIDVWQDAVPGVTITRRKNFQPFDLPQGF